MSPSPLPGGDGSLREWAPGSCPGRAPMRRSPAVDGLIQSRFDPLANQAIRALVFVGGATQRAVGMSVLYPFQVLANVMTSFIRNSTPCTAALVITRLVLGAIGMPKD